MSSIQFRRSTIAMLSLLSSACSDPSTSPASGGADGGGSLHVADALTLDLNHLPNYANPSWPVHYDARVMSQDNAPDDNPVTNRGAALGRVLFYDRRLSINNAISCAGCHQQARGFTDRARLSLGFDRERRTTRHAMRLLNARFYPPGTAFWDRRAASLEAQATEPLQHPVEMGFDSTHGGLDSLLSKMRGLPYYLELFAFTFGDSAITQARIQLALAQFARSIVSIDSRFDQGFAKVYNPGLADRGITAPFPGLTFEENRGKQLFLLSPASGGAGCAACHAPPTFALVGSTLSNGLDAGETTIFKAPALKNITAGPYMHDGRFSTLEQVVEFYVSGVQEGPALDNRLRGPGGLPQRLALSSADKSALVAFLRTLADTVVASSPKFADPFKR